ncbi:MULTISPECIES: DinB family protein [Oceanobacillus]|uniref:DinB family protein n=1 Tax=Oceanobacillus aidingensis TaxID=645964 RepID=A0ABV9K1D6_9BACI|nr:DinB family protein [Oceanobacillus oncorhynchi]MDM8101789.1 DinB family protein [Oceanobacillus oncorhynchi]UUI41743.1 DinB family protein [Oceanobacillus oncorhynchi]
MNTNELITLNFEEVRRRSEKVWRAIPEELLQWRPDENAISCSEMIRHVLEGEFLYHQIILGRGSRALTNISNPFEDRVFTTVDDELEFAKKYRNEFIKYIKTIHINDLENIEIDRSDVGYKRKLGDMLLRIAYHESVHTGQLLSYMRTMGVERPNIWD